MLKRRSDTDLKNKQTKNVCSGAGLASRGFLVHASVVEMECVQRRYQYTFKALFYNKRVKRFKYFKYFSTCRLKWKDLFSPQTSLRTCVIAPFALNTYQIPDSCEGCNSCHHGPSRNCMCIYSLQEQEIMCTLWENWNALLDQFSLPVAVSHIGICWMQVLIVCWPINGLQYALHNWTWKTMHSQVQDIQTAVDN